jgi:hypothetical protein
MAHFARSFTVVLSIVSLASLASVGCTNEVAQEKAPEPPPVCHDDRAASAKPLGENEEQPGREMSAPCTKMAPAPAPAENAENVVPKYNDGNGKDHWALD